jgi:hypothetical protein
LLQRQTQTAQYWKEFRVTNADIEHIYNLLLEEETPLSLDELALEVIEYRAREEDKAFRQQLAKGELYQPRKTYEAGQSLVFPALSYTVGTVVGERPGSNPEHGDFTVIQVEFDNQRRREFASQLITPHALNRDGDPLTWGGDVLDPDTILERYGDYIWGPLFERLKGEEDIVSIADRWFPKSLLVEINVGHLNLAEAVLDLSGGGPLETASLLKDVGLPSEVNERLQSFSLDYALQEDDRFDEVGPSGQVLWYLRRLEPPEVINPPKRLLYTPLEYDRTVLTAEMLVLEEDLDDEFSPLSDAALAPGETTLTLTFPHRRAGTLPLSSGLRPIFPTALQAPRVRLTMVDGQTGEEFAGWVVRRERFVFGFSDYYRRYRIPVGAYINVRPMDDPGRVMITHEDRRPRTEWIRMAMVDDNRLVFDIQRRSIGAGYDDLMIVSADDLDAIDELWVAVNSGRKKSLLDLLRQLVPELAKLNPQGTVHAKTLYSALNVIRRCPPGPIFALLALQPEFEYVGDGYWRFDRSQM